jgi:hypothetical protein
MTGTNGQKGLFVVLGVRLFNALPRRGRAFRSRAAIQHVISLGEPLTNLYCMNYRRPESETRG